MTSKLSDYPSFKTLHKLKGLRRALLRYGRTCRAKHGSFSFKREDGEVWFQYESWSWRDEEYTYYWRMAEKMTECYKRLEARIAKAQVAYDVDKFHHMTALWERLKIKYTQAA